MLDLQTCNIPAVLAQEPSKEVSGRYSFIPTTRLIDDLKTMDWLPVGAKGSTRAHDVAARHMIRFRSREHLESPVQAVCPELVVINAHNGLCSFNLKAGLFRLVCSNGMIVSEAVFASIKIRHINYTYEAVRDAVFQYAAQMPQITQKVHELQAIRLDETLKTTFARQALALRFEDRPDAAQLVDVQSLLRPMRTADTGQDVWSVLNVLQEKLINGKFVIGDKKRQARSIQNVQRTVSLNQRLFDLAVSIGKLA
ncbi:DUF932 domain-containing protein [Turneriella parva]|uniref:DUF932 domain-containing protein n=1 Tax=Turneriella parva (strain ATCC BAA-1111 / DSM 21527 / NCTC 11395 / H) TaxID=869212 RepID=I4BAB4_TURPD|nr:DUF932 domain-containing protein [Turneriella parva]AFM14221.1 protein of unknown function DUF932 [Turneriella parva DSM 21527]